MQIEGLRVVSQNGSGILQYAAKQHRLVQRLVALAWYSDSPLQCNIATRRFSVGDYFIATRCFSVIKRLVAIVWGVVWYSESLR